MPDPHVWECPGCGAMVRLPPEVQTNNARDDTYRLDQLAQALCGCWVVNLSSGGVSRLLGAIMTGDEHRDTGSRRTATGAGA